MYNRGCGFPLLLVLGIMSSNALTGGGNSIIPQQPTHKVKEEQPKSCLPCEGMDLSARLRPPHIQDRASALPFWTVVPLGAADDAPVETDEEPSRFMLSRTFTARNFQAAMDALNAMGVIAERENHHFDFHLTNYRNVKIDIFTHSVQGLTENDFILAHLLNTVTVDYSPKWLKDNPVVHP
jgi:4a-hydroxytetrahydrobiopterin dehydratase